MKVLIVEDEPAAARRLQKMLQELRPEAEVLAITDSIETTVALFQQQPNLDLILMDIHLADGPCFDIFEHVEVLVPVIFTTAYDQYAIQAFKSHAIDYLLKPIKLDSLQQSLDKLDSLRTWAADFQSIAEGIDKPLQQNWQKRFLLKLGPNIQLITSDEIAYFYTEDKITLLVTNAGKRFPFDFSLEQVEQMVDPLKFFRVNRQFIVERNSIKEMHAYPKSRIKLELSPSIDQDIVVPFDRIANFKYWMSGS
ncbi:MAG: LytTR family DNA-binding domain-containing protein [Saprospiraceae bacterium]